MKNKYINHVLPHTQSPGKMDNFLGNFLLRIGKDGNQKLKKMATGRTNRGVKISLKIGTFRRKVEETRVEKLAKKNDYCLFMVTEIHHGNGQ